MTTLEQILPMHELTALQGYAILNTLQSIKPVQTELSPHSVHFPLGFSFRRIEGFFYDSWSLICFRDYYNSPSSSDIGNRNHQVNINNFHKTMSTSGPSAGSDVPAGEDSSRTSTFTLQIVSPSSGPLSFQDLPVNTTVKQLKGKIREALPSKPIDENQRIIYRGRMLATETATMLDVFGKEAVRLLPHFQRALLTWNFL